MIDYQEIGNNIKICRIRCNLKQAELAEMVGVTSQHISHVERCQTKPSLTLLVDPERSTSAEHCWRSLLAARQNNYQIIVTKPIIHEMN